MNQSLRVPPADPSDALFDRQQFAASLLRWFDHSSRDLPWRRHPDPYAVWVSEIMLQQTQVATVIPYFERWMVRFPTVQALASASEDEVLEQWQGLGYYRRARLLLAGARHVVREHGGQIPSDVSQLRILPGIGEYTAGAISSIAFGQTAPLIDGNVERVLCRVFARRGDPRRQPLRKQLWEAAAELISPSRPGDFNQALMELGATLCTPVAPRCGQCPVQEQCAGYRRGEAQDLPELAPRPAVTQVMMAAAVLRRGGEVLLRQVAADAPRWAGMWQFPNTEVSNHHSPLEALSRILGPVRWDTDPPSIFRHSVTRYRITLQVFHGRPTAGFEASDSSWVPSHLLYQRALPAVHRRIAESLVSQLPGKESQ